MILNEIFKYGYLIEDEDQINKAISDLVVQLKVTEVRSSSIENFIKELSNMMPIYLDPHDETTQNKISDLINQSGMANVEADTVILEPDDEDDGDEDAGQEADDEKEKEDEKYQKMAFDRVKQRASGEDVE